MRLRQASRLVADLDRVLTADDAMSLEASDVLASRVFVKPIGDCAEVRWKTATFREWPLLAQKRTSTFHNNDRRHPMLAHLRTFVRTSMSAKFANSHALVSVLRSAANLRR
jgi:hypothetical protein